MNHNSLVQAIEDAWDARDELTTETQGDAAAAVREALNLLDKGAVRVAEPTDAGWSVNQWCKKAVLLSFRLNVMATMAGGPGDNTSWWDKVPSKFEGWGAAEFTAAGFRAVPTCVVRHSDITTVVVAVTVVGLAGLVLGSLSYMILPRVRQAR